MEWSRRTTRWIAIACIAFASATAGAQQVVDPQFNPAPPEHPEYKADSGPLVMVDEAHFNYHTISGLYEPFARVLRLDGFRVQPFKSKFSRKTLKQADILVIANAVSEAVSKSWQAPPTSAFSDEEIESVRKWVRGGGALFLIVDHMPAPGGASKLASAFGVTWSDGYAQDPASGGLIVFKSSDGSLGDHPITRGRNDAERIERVGTFAGSAFQAPGAQPLLTFKGEAVSWLPKVAGQLDASTPNVSVKGWQQGAVLRFGKGRVALFGEAAMFTAQLAGPRQERFGMSSKMAPQNRQFLLNVTHWLAGSLE
jgi:hypothetical protein